MRGREGTSIQLTIFRPGRDEPFDLDVTRGVIELEPVTWELHEGNIGHIMVNEFSRDVGSDVFSAWEALKGEASRRVTVWCSICAQIPVVRLTRRLPCRTCS